MDNRVKIKNVNFDIEIPDQETFHTISDELISFNEYKLEPLIDSVIQQMNLKESYVFDRIEINVGAIVSKRLDLIEQSIKKSLQNAIQEQIQSGDAQVSDRGAEGILYYVQKGRFPWWSDKDSFLNLFQNPKTLKPQFTRDLINKIIQNKSAYFRLVDSLTAQKMIPFWRHIFQQNYAYSQTLIQFFEFLFSHLGNFTQASFDRRALEYFMLKSHHNNPNQKAIFLEVFTALSEKFEWDVRYVFSEVKSLLKNKNTLIDAQIRSFFEGGFPKFEKAVKAQSSSNETIAARLIEYLETGATSRSFPFSDLPELSKALEFQLQSTPKQLLHYLSKDTFFESPIKLGRFLKILSSRGQQQLIEGLLPKNLTKTAIQLMDYFQASNFVKALGKKPSKIQGVSIRQLGILIFLKKKLPTQSTKAFVRAFIDAIAQQYGLKQEEFVVMLHDSVLQKAPGKAIQEILQSEYIRTINQKMGTYYSIDALPTPYLESEKKVSPFISWEAGQTKAAISQNIQQYISSYPLTYFQKHLVEYLFMRFLPLQRQQQMASFFSSPTKWLEFVVRFVQQGKSEHLEGVLERFIDTMEAQSRMKKTFFMAFMMRQIEDEKEKKAIDFSFLSLLKQELSKLAKQDDFEEYGELIKSDETALIATATATSNAAEFKSLPQRLQNNLNALNLKPEQKNMLSGFIRIYREHPQTYERFFASETAFMTFVGAFLKEEKLMDYPTALRKLNQNLEQATSRFSDATQPAFDGQQSYFKKLDKKTQLTLKAFNLNKQQLEVAAHLIQSYKKSKQQKYFFESETEFTQYITARLAEEKTKDVVALIQKMGSELDQLNPSRQIQNTIAYDPSEERRQQLERSLQNEFESQGLNPYQKQMAAFIVEQFPEFNKNTVFAKQFSSQQNFAKQIATLLKKASTENFNTLIQQVFSDLGKILNTNPQPWIDRITFVKQQQNATTVLDLKWLALFVPETEEQQGFTDLQVELSNFSFFERSFYNFIKKAYQPLQKLSRFKDAFKNEKAFSEFIARQIKAATTENFDVLVAHLITQMAEETGIRSNNLQAVLLENIQGQAQKTNFDYRFILRYSDSIRPDTVEEINKLFEKEPQLKPSFFQKSILQYLYELFEPMFTDAAFKKRFADKGKWAAFVIEKTKDRPAEDFDFTIIMLINSVIESGKMKYEVTMGALLDQLSKTSSFQATDHRVLNLLMSEILKASASKKIKVENVIKNVTQLDTLLLQLITQNSQGVAQFERLMYYPALLEKIEDSTFNKILAHLSNDKNINYFDLLNEMIALLPESKGTALTPKLKRYAFKIILTQRSRLSPGSFVNEIIQHLVLHDPAYFNEPSMKKELDRLKISGSSADKKTIRDILDQFKKKDVMNQGVDSSENKIDDFEFMLALKNNIASTPEHSSETAAEFDLNSLDSILKSVTSLLQFLESYSEDNEILVAFTELSLKNEYASSFKKRVQQINTTAFQVEQTLIDLQTNYRYSSLATDTFAVLVRTFLLQRLPAIQTYKHFTIEEFALDFVYLLSKERYLDLRNMLQLSQRTPTAAIEKKVVEAFALFRDRGLYEGVNKKSKEAIYLKDLTFHFLKFGKQPHWSRTEIFDLEDAVTFVKSKIKTLDTLYLEQLFSEETIKTVLVKELLMEPLVFQEKLLNLLQRTKPTPSIGSLFNRLLTLLEAQQLSPSASNQAVLFRLIIQENLWKISNPVVIIERLHEQIAKDISISRKSLLTSLSSIFPIAGKMIGLEKDPTLSKEESKTLVTYYLERGVIPFHLNIYKKEILAQMRAFLNQNKEALGSILEEQIITSVKMERLIDLLTRSTFERYLKTQYFSKEASLLAFNTLLFKSLKEKKISDTLYFEILETSYQKFVVGGQKSQGVTEILLFLKKTSLPLFETIVAALKKDFEQGVIKTDSLIGKMIDIKDQKLIIESVETSSTTTVFSPLQIIEYYIEFGSVEINFQNYSPSELYQLLLEALKKTPLKFKKRLHRWSAGSVQRNLFLSLYPAGSKENALQLIHPALLESLRMLETVLEKYMGMNLIKTLGLTNTESLVLMLLQYWASNSLIIDNPSRILQKIVAEIFVKTDYTQDRFFDELIPLMKELNKVEELQLLENLKSYFEKATRTSVSSSVKEEKTEAIVVDDTETMYVQNAGLIIVWPFLYRLFDKLDLLSNKLFKDDDAVQKAILLTQYLCTGNEDFDENELILNKLICGVDVNHFVDVSRRLEDFEKEFCESLLKGVVQNWEKIGNTSTEGLRESFLRREGLIRKTNKDYTLIVKKKPFDMLLDTLPWNITMVQNVFMKYRLLVEWN